MAKSNVTQNKPSIPHDEAAKVSDAAFAVVQLGDLLRQSKEHAGFEGIEKKHWIAIGIAIEQLSSAVYYSPILNDLEGA